MKKERIDNLLVSRGFAETKEMAGALVMSGVVLVNDLRVEKSSQEFFPDVEIRIKGKSEQSKYVGRGGLKLEKALREFHIQPNEYVCLDIGASTGGFTDCLLQNGAKKVYAVDAGTNQIAWRLRCDARVEVRENTNARNLKAENFSESFDLIVMDVSFISVKKIFPALPPLLKEGGKIITLIKPQFEVAKGEVGAGGVVREPAKHERVIVEINDAAKRNGLLVFGGVESPLTGAGGNQEFLALYEKRTDN